MKRVRGSSKATLESLKLLTDECAKLTTRWIVLIEQADALKNKIAGLERAIELLRQSDEPGAAPSTQQELPEGGVKTLIIDFAREAKTDGINANIAVAMAEKRGIKLLRGTAASNLSRLKADGALIHSGERYRLPEFVRRPATSGGFSSGGFGSPPPPSGVAAAQLMPTTAAEVISAVRFKGS
jgi:hypothetical protein